MKQKSVVYLIIKHDAITRDIVDEILTYLSERLTIRDVRPAQLIPEQVDQLKDSEFRNKWKKYPDPYIKQLVLSYESQPVIAVTCNSPGGEPFRFLRNLKGNHHIPHLCNHNSVRWLFRDPEQEQRLFSYDDDILLEHKADGTVVFPESIIHTPDSWEDNQLLASLLDI